SPNRRWGDFVSLGEPPASQECLEETRRLEYLEPHVLDAPGTEPDQQAPLPLDPGQRAGPDGPLLQASPPGQPRPNGPRTPTTVPGRLLQSASVTAPTAR